MVFVYDPFEAQASQEQLSTSRCKVSLLRELGKLGLLAQTKTFIYAKGLSMLRARLQGPGHELRGY